MITPMETGEDVEKLLGLLSEDLRSKGLAGLARLPQPRVGERYRDLLKQLYRSTGLAQATVWIERTDGIRRIYTFLIQADLVSPVSSLLEAPATVSGHVIEVKRGGVSYIKYRPRRYNSAVDLFMEIEEFASLYRLSEDRILREKVLEGYYDWL